MPHLKILFDADDVAENLAQGWINILNERYGTSVSLEDVTDWNISLAFPTLTKGQIYGVLQENSFGQICSLSQVHRSISNVSMTRGTSYIWSQRPTTAPVM